MEKLQDLKKLKDLLDTNVINEDEFNNMKNEILSKSTENNSTEDKEGSLNISFPGQWFLFDSKVRLFINSTLHSTHSIKKGFITNVPLTNSYVNLKVTIGGIRSTVIEIADIETSKDYELELRYDTVLGKFSKQFYFAKNN